MTSNGKSNSKQHKQNKATKKNNALRQSRSAPLNHMPIRTQPVSICICRFCRRKIQAIVTLHNITKQRQLSFSSFDN